MGLTLKTCFVKTLTCSCPDVGETCINHFPKHLALLEGSTAVFTTMASAETLDPMSSHHLQLPFTIYVSGY